MTAKGNAQRLKAIETALVHLRAARIYLRIAAAPHARAYVARAMKSADGARRHAAGRAYRP